MRDADIRFAVIPHETDSSRIVVADTKTESVAVIQIRGRWCYCRECEAKDKFGEIYLPDKSKDRSGGFCEVLAVSRDCGKWHKLTKSEKRLPDMCPQVNFDVNAGDMVLVPQDHVFGIWVSVYSSSEFFIHECVVMANCGRVKHG